MIQVSTIVLLLVLLLGVTSIYFKRFKAKKNLNFINHFITHWTHVLHNAIEFVKDGTEATPFPREDYETALRQATRIQSLYVQTYESSGNRSIPIIIDSFYVTRIIKSVGDAAVDVDTDRLYEILADFKEDLLVWAGFQEERVEEYSNRLRNPLMWALEGFTLLFLPVTIWRYVDNDQISLAWKLFSIITGLMTYVVLFRDFWNLAQFLFPTLLPAP